MKTMKRYFAILVVLIMMFTVAPYSAFAGEKEYSGFCGADGETNVAWSFDPETGVLELTGSGEMEMDYDEEPGGQYGVVPWYEYRDQIVVVSIEDGITSIGNWAFAHTQVSELQIPPSVETIGENAMPENPEAADIDEAVQTESPMQSESAPAEATQETVETEATQEAPQAETTQAQSGTMQKSQPAAKDSGLGVLKESASGDMDAESNLKASGTVGQTAKAKTVTDLPKVKIKKPKAGKTSMTVKWKKVSKKNRKKTKNIQIQYSTDKSFSDDVQTVYAKSKKKSKKIKKLEKGERYYVRVRAYTKSGDVTHFSKWSATKSVKLKGKKAKTMLSATSLTLAKGGSHQIKLKKGKGKWSVSGSSIIGVAKKTDKYITVTPKKAGTAKVTCKVGKKSYTCTVRVINNRIGNPKDEFGYAMVVGQPMTLNAEMPNGLSITKKSYDSKRAKLTISSERVSDEYTMVNITIKALKPGRFKLHLEYSDGSIEDATFLFIKGFRGSTKVSKNSANYAKWRHSIISSMVSSDVSSWEIIDAIGTLISTGKYGSKGGATGMQLWYGGNGTCVSGAKMMDDFMKDLGIKSKVHFAGKSGGATDIYGYSIMYMSQHKNTWVTLGGKTYELNPEPGASWPFGTVAR